MPNFLAARMGSLTAQRCTPDGSVLWLPCRAGCIQKTSLSAHPATSYNRSRAAVETRDLEGQARATGRLPGPPGHPVGTIFRIKSLVCCTALAGARPSRPSALRHGARLPERPGDLQLRGCGSARKKGVSPHAFLIFFALCISGTRESLAAPNLEHDYLTRRTGRM